MKRLFFVLMTLLGMLCAAQANSESLPESSLKAAYLYNFALLTEWPSSKSEEPLNFCFYYGRDWEAAINILKEKQINNRVVQITHIVEFENIKTCHVLVIGKTERYPVQQALNAVSNLPILTIQTITSINSPSESVIGLAEENKHLLFVVNLMKAKRLGLVLNSRLLGVARKVIS